MSENDRIIEFLSYFCPILKKNSDYVSKWYDTSAGFQRMGAPIFSVSGYRVINSNLLYTVEVCFFQKHHPVT
jgi:hypothetical protein